MTFLNRNENLLIPDCKIVSIFKEFISAICDRYCSVSRESNTGRNDGAERAGGQCDC